jgi:hypothetical protein
MPPVDWRAKPALHGIEPDPVAKALRSERSAAGLARLELMLTAVLPRLVGETRTQRAD